MSFNIDDLLRINENEKGYINIIRLTDVQYKPKLFSTFMLSLLAEIYQQIFKKDGSEQPELLIFIDAAHLNFIEAGTAVLEQIETLVKLIGSKGIEIYFVTQKTNRCYKR
jgi:hypothetical protein